MRKIIIVDDRLQRQAQLLPKGNEDVETLNTIGYVENKIGEKCKNFLERLKAKDYSELLTFDLWIMHRSFLVENAQVNIIQSLAKQNKKHLIFFSGGITQSSYSQEDYPFLNINSKVLYSGSVFGFLDDFSNKQDINLLSLVHGEGWMLAYLMKYRQLLLGVEFPGNQDELKDDLEGITGIMGIEDVNLRINQIISLI